MSAVAVVEPWEIHSELVLVSPEVYERALELLPARDPDAFLARSREPVSLPASRPDKKRHGLRFSAVVLEYALWRLAETARAALITVGAVAALALLADAVH
jgi:hypothetical protein